MRANNVIISALLAFTTAFSLVIIAEMFCDVSCWFVLKPLAHIILLGGAVIILKDKAPKVRLKLKLCLLISLAMLFNGLFIAYLVKSELFESYRFLAFGILTRNISASANQKIFYFRALYVLIANAFFEEYYFRKALIETFDRGYHLQVVLFTLWHIYMGFVGTFLLALPMSIILGKYYFDTRDFCGVFFAHILVNVGLGLGLIIS